MKFLKQKFYLRKFHNKPFVIKIGGEVIQSKDILINILKDIKELFEANIPVILVHGGGSQADSVAKKMGYQPKKINGRRITSLEDLEIVKMLYGGSLNLEILSLLKKINLKGIRVSGLDGNLLDVTKRVHPDIDYGYVGDIQQVNPQILLDLLSKKYLPIVSPLAVTKEGTIMNINADTIAIELAISLQAEKLIIFTNTDGIYHGKTLLSTLTESEAKNLIKDQIVTDGMAVKLSNCLKALHHQVKRIHLLNGLSPHSLLKEVLTKKGIGTMIIADTEKPVYEKE